MPHVSKVPRLVYVIICCCANPASSHAIEQFETFTPGPLLRCDSVDFDLHMLLDHRVSTVSPVSRLLIGLKQGHVQRREEVGKGQVTLHPSNAVAQDLSLTEIPSEGQQKECILKLTSDRCKPATLCQKQPCSGPDCRCPTIALECTVWGWGRYRHSSKRS